MDWLAVFLGLTIWLFIGFYIYYLRAMARMRLSLILGLKGRIGR